MNKTVRIVILALFLVLSKTPLFAQFAIVNNKDGYVNVRSSPEIEPNNIIDTLHNGSFVYVENIYKINDKNWTGIIFKSAYFGYVYVNDIKDISDYQCIEYVSKNENILIFRDSNISVEIKIREFDKSKHKIKYRKKNVHSIDGKEGFLGTGGSLPRYEYEYIRVTMNGTIYFLPNEAMENLYEPNSNYPIPDGGYILLVSPFYDKENDILYIKSDNGDGAYGYAVVWKIEKEIYKERAVRLFYGGIIKSDK